MKNIIRNGSTPVVFEATDAKDSKQNCEKLNHVVIIDEGKEKKTVLMS